MQKTIDGFFFSRPILCSSGRNVSEKCTSNFIAIHKGQEDPPATCDNLIIIEYLIAHFFSLVNCTSSITFYKLTRPLENHFLQTFTPSIMFSYASAASVFIPHKNTPGRMALCVTTLLSLVTLFNGARYVQTRMSTPIVST